MTTEPECTCPRTWYGLNLSTACRVHAEEAAVYVHAALVQIVKDAAPKPA